MFFIVSKIFWLLVQPVSVVLLLVLASMGLAWRGWRKTGIGLAGLAALLLAVLGYTSAGALMIQPLEQRFERPAAMPDAIGAIVVLGGATNSEISAARGRSEFNAAGDRMIEALRLARLYPTAQVIFSGGVGTLAGGDVMETEAETAARFFLEQGVARERLVLESAARNTAQNAAFLRDLIPRGDGAVLLVTSAYHMPRSMGLFRKADLDLVPWPVDYRSTGRANLNIDINDPAANLVLAGVALHEWAGLIAYSVTGRIDRLFPAP